MTGVYDWIFVDISPDQNPSTKCIFKYL